MVPPFVWHRWRLRCSSRPAGGSWHLHCDGLKQQQQAQVRCQLHVGEIESVPQTQLGQIYKRTPDM